MLYAGHRCEWIVCVTRPSETNMGSVEERMKGVTEILTEESLF